MSMTYGKKYYDFIKIPEALHSMTEEAIRSRRKKTPMWRRYTAAAVIVLLFGTVGMTSDPVMAENLSKVPVLGELIQTLTQRSFHGAKGELVIDMEVPQLESPADLPERVSREIQQFADEYMQQAAEEYVLYRQAFFMTGGTEEQWAEHENTVVIDYDVTYYDKNTLSLIFRTGKSWGGMEEMNHYYNIDLSGDRMLTLEDMLGESYAEICDESIRQQIKERLAADDTLTYYGFGGADSFPGYTGVTAETDFYLNEAGEVVVAFPAYEIAPGFMGTQEFTIAYKY